MAMAMAMGMLYIYALLHYHTHTHPNNPPSSSSPPSLSPSITHLGPQEVRKHLGLRHQVPQPPLRLVVPAPTTAPLAGRGPHPRRRHRLLRGALVCSLFVCVFRNRV